MASLKDKVSYCLTKHQDCRNSDKKLINAIYYEYYNEKLITSIDGKLAVRLMDLYDLPNPAHIIRWRQKLNEEGKFLPTSEEVIRQRGLLEKTWHNEMSPSNPSKF